MYGSLLDLVEVGIIIGVDGLRARVVEQWFGKITALWTFLIYTI